MSEYQTTKIQTTSKPNGKEFVFGTYFGYLNQIRPVQIDVKTTFDLGFFSSDFRQRPKSELSGNRTKANCVNTKPVQYSDIHCITFFTV